MINNLPFENMDFQNRKRVISIVNQIIAIKNNDENADISSLETEIDKVVFEIYKLSPDEIRIVENE